MNPDRPFLFIPHFVLLRTTPSGQQVVDKYADLVSAVTAVQSDYLADSPDGERYAVVDLSTGDVVRNYVVRNVPTLERVS